MCCGGSPSARSTGCGIGRRCWGARRAPAGSSRKSRFVGGRVIGGSGVARTFLPFLVSTLGVPLMDLEPGASREDSITLFSGPAGDLFPAPGVYRVEVDMRWHGPEKKI